MAAARDFTELLFWQRARQWAKDVFHASRDEPFCRDRRLVEQINDSAESVMSNIAEGFGRGTQGEFVMFLGYAIASADEARSHLCAAFDRQYLAKDRFAAMYGEGMAIRKMMVGFISSMVQAGSGAKNLRKRPDWTEEVWSRYERVTGRRRPAMFERKEEEE